MAKEQSAIKNNKGVSLIEALLVVAVLAILAIFAMDGLIQGTDSSVVAGKRSRAVFLAEECLEAARNIRDNDYNNLTVGTFGLAVAGNIWTLSGSSDLTDIYTRQIVVSTISTTTKQVTCTINWQQNLQRTGTIALTTYLTNWRGSTFTTCAQYCQSLGYTTGTCRRNNGACTANGETRQTGGAVYCTVNPNRTCCCKP